MGRRPYMTQLALGRSAFEPLPETSDTDPEASLAKAHRPETFETQDEMAGSNTTSDTQINLADQTSQATRIRETPVYQQQYNRRGHPENLASRELSRQSRRAMNDVLATVGICTGRNSFDYNPTVSERSKSSIDSAKLDDIGAENGIGLILDSVEQTLLSTVSVTIVGLRHRLQAFRFYSRIPLTQILGRERVQFGVVKLLFLGTPAYALYAILAGTRAWAIETFISSVDEYVETTLTSDIPNVLIQTTYLSITALSCAILAPLEMFSVLQGLGLLPGWPWFPHPKSFIPFSPSSPIQLPILPTTLTLGSALEYLASITVSPLFLWWIIVRTKPVVRGKLQAYIRASVPKPQRPDRYSLEAAKADELDEDSIPGLCNDPNGDPSGWESKSFLEELAKDLQYLGRKFQPLYDRLAQIISRYRTNPQHITPGGLRSQLPRTPSQSTSSTSTPDTPSNFPSTPETPPPPIEITTSIMGTNTIHMDVQISTPNTYNDPLGNNSYSNPPPTNEPEVQNENNLKETESSLYRVTTLTAFAADSMSHRLASHITELLFLPLEALFVRSLALGFLSSPRADPLAQAAASRWRSQVFPLGGWFGMGLRAGGWKGAADYAAKTALIFGMEMGFNLTVWQICTGIALVSGRRCFGWGKL